MMLSYVALIQGVWDNQQEGMIPGTSERIYDSSSTIFSNFTASIKHQALIFNNITPDFQCVCDQVAKFRGRDLPSTCTMARWCWRGSNAGQTIASKSYRRKKKKKKNNVLVSGEIFRNFFS